MLWIFPEDNLNIVPGAAQAEDPSARLPFGAYGWGGVGKRVDSV